MKVGSFITFEGGEGSGKSTQVKILENRLTSLNYGVISTREPGGSILAERLRTLILDPTLTDYSALTEALLFSAGRSDHLDQIIRPALRQGQIVICDRFSDSTRVYQGYAGNLDTQILNSLESIVLGPTVPDLTIIIDLPVNVGLDRAQKRSGKKSASTQKCNAIPNTVINSQTDRYESRSLDYHERLRQGFLKIARLESERCVIINGLENVDNVSNAIWSVVEMRILKRNR